MHTHELLRVLQQVEERLPSMLHHPFTEWQGVDLDGEAPRIERVWTRMEQFRICLDRIHECEQAVFHRHAWPSAVHVLSGRLEMAVGYGAGPNPPVAATLLLNESARYEMVTPDGWHSVRALNGPSLSLVVAGPAWDHGLAGDELPQKPLATEAKESILGQFRERYRSLR